LHVQGNNLKPVWVSENVETLLGYSIQEACQLDWWDSCIHPDDREIVATESGRLFSVNHSVREYRFKRKAGDYRWISDEQRLIRDPQGRPAEVVGSWTDITERKQLEEQLRQAQKMDAIGQLAGGVAHDFNNLLTVIRGNAELLMMSSGELAGESKDWLNQVVSASDRAAGLTRQLLVFGRKQVMRPKPLRLDATVTEMTKMLGRLIGANIKLSCHHADPLPPIHADPGMIEQVLMNLVVNARDAMPAGGQLTIVTEPVWLDERIVKEHGKTQAGEFVRLSVSDTGSGIAPAILGRIFEPFFTTKEIGKGTGLGLSTVYGIVEQHHGWIEVKSEVNHGTMFELYFPSISTLTGHERDAGPATQLRGGNEHILLVEDDEPVRLFAAEVLRRLDYVVSEADSGKTALERWRTGANDIDLVLTDIMMPDQTGWELARTLHCERPGLRMVFVSGYSPDAIEKENQFLRDEGIFFLQKPYSSLALAHMVRECLDKKPVE
jgi:PAS domain S-box-containing protein